MPWFSTTSRGVLASSSGRADWSSTQVMIQRRAARRPLLILSSPIGDDCQAIPTFWADSLSVQARVVLTIGKRWRYIPGISFRPPPNKERGWKPFCSRSFVSRFFAREER